MSVERDITILQNPKNFIDSLIQKRNLFPPDVIKRVSTDGRDNSMKMIANVFDKHQDPEISFLGRDKKGSQYSGVNKANILAYCENLEENHNNLRLILEHLQVYINTIYIVHIIYFNV